MLTESVGINPEASRLAGVRSRGIIFAHKRKDLAERFAPGDWEQAVETATREMIADLAANTPADRL